MNMHTPVDLGDELERVIARMIREGRFASRDEVLRAGVRTLIERALNLDTVEEAIRAGLADAEAGRTKPADEVFDRLIAKYRAMIPE